MIPPRDEWWRDPLICGFIGIIVAAVLISAALYFAGNGTASQRDAEEHAVIRAEAEARCDTLLRAAGAGKLDSVYIRPDTVGPR